jgi:hypothetical protein
MRRSVLKGGMLVFVICGFIKNFKRNENVKEMIILLHTLYGNINLKRSPKPNKSGINTSRKVVTFLTVLPKRYTQFPTIGMFPTANAILIHENRTDVDPNHIAVSLYFVQVKIKQSPAQKRLPKSNQFDA